MTAAAPPFLGVLMLDTRFPRPVGDIGNPASWSMPVRTVVLKGAWPDKVVATAASLRKERLVDPFQRMVRKLCADGAGAITTSCGFLVLLQAELQAAAGKVPVVSSSLLQLPQLLSQHAQVGVLTIQSQLLGHEHLRAAGVPRERLKDVCIQGMARSGAFAAPILNNSSKMDPTAAQADVVQAALALQAKHPSLTELVLECTNMPPHAAAISEASGLRCWSLLQSQRLLAAFAQAA